MPRKREARTIEVREFKIKNMRPNCKIALIGRPNSGKSTVIDYLLCYWNHLFSTALVFNGTENETQFYQNNHESYGCDNVKNPKIPPIYIDDDFEENGERMVKDFVIRMKIIQTKIKNGEIPPHEGWGLLVCDDMSENSDIMKKKVFKTLMKMGRHWPMMFIFGMQNPVDLSTQLRAAFDYVFLMECNEEKTMRSIHENYAGKFTNFRDFEDVMKQVAVNFGALVIDNTVKTNSGKIEDYIFYFKPPYPAPEYHFGCPLYRKKNEKEYDTNYDPINDLLEDNPTTNKKKK
jgi:hypothetical protein